jgi:hypothetical protein
MRPSVYGLAPILWMSGNGTFLLRFSDAGQLHAGRQLQAQPAGIRKPAENEAAGDDARSSSNGLWGFEGVGWRDGGAARCELNSLRGR